MNRLLSFSCSIVLTAAALATPVQAQFDPLVSRVSPDVNALMMMNVEAMKKSQLAVREGWGERHERMFESGLIIVPPKSTLFVSAAKFDLESMSAVKQMSVMKLTEEPDMTDVAVRYRGTVDVIDKRDVAILPGELFIVKLSKDIVAMGSPATRQDVGRWMNRIYSTTPVTHSAYLEEAKAFANSGAGMIFALDLTHAISPALIKERLPEFECVKDRNIDIEAAADALASIRGVTLGVSVTDKRGGSVKVDFAGDISPIKDIAKPLLLEVLARNGAAISEFYDWEAIVGEKEIRLRGELFQSGTRRIMSLLEAPPSLDAKPTSARDDQDDEQTSQQKALYASQLYFKSVSSLIEDLRGQKQNRQTMGQLSVWFDRYARKIDRLPQVGVDPILLDYGQYVTSTFRGGSSSVTQAAATSRIEQSQVPEQYDVHTWSTPIGVVGGGGGRWGMGWGGGGVYGWGGWQATPNNLRRGRIQSQIRTKQNIKGSLSANTVLQQVDAATADVRRAMTEKYSAEF